MTIRRPAVDDTFGRMYVQLHVSTAEKQHAMRASMESMIFQNRPLNTKPIQEFYFPLYGSIELKKEIIGRFFRFSLPSHFTLGAFNSCPSRHIAMSSINKSPSTCLLQWPARSYHLQSMSLPFSTLLTELTLNDITHPRNLVFEI
jgi:hypothetical protein